jgi:hypothetical protein
MNRLLLAPIVLIGLVFATACGGNSNAAGPDVPTPTQPAPPSDGPAGESPTPAPVPGLFIVDPANGQGTSATAGTRCWADVCLDYLGPVTTPDPIAFDAGATLQWQAEGGTVDTISHVWVSAEGAESEVTSDRTRVWPRIGGDFSDGEIVVPTEAGDYVLLVFTTYTGGGDVAWGVYVAVE